MTREEAIAEIERLLECAKKLEGPQTFVEFRPAPALEMALAALRGPTTALPNEWARVKERLPEKKQDVLMLFNAGNMAVGWLNDTDWCAYTDDGFYTDCDSAPIYWMPLPKPPKGTEDVAENATTAERCAWHEWIKERFGDVR